MPKQRFFVLRLAFCVIGCAAWADDQGADRLAAALNLANAGIERGEVAPLILAREILAGLAPSGSAVEALESKWDSEAHFLARGNPDILSRLNGIRKGAADADLYLVELTPSISLPEGSGLARITAPDGVTVFAIMSTGQSVCTISSVPAIWICDPRKARGEIEVEGQGRDDTTYLILTTESGQ